MIRVVPGIFLGTIVSRLTDSTYSSLGFFALRRHG
jgi:hypothetical protein